MATHASAAVRRARRAELLRGIYVILNDGPRTLELAHAVLAGGVRIVQYRAKRGVHGERLAALRRLTRERGALLIMNDDRHAAKHFDCDGLHLGPDDEGFAGLAAVREAVPDHVIGLSCGTISEVRDANETDADYLGVGSVYATTSKSDAGAPIGIERLRLLANSSRLPVAAIGGITPQRLEPVRRTGVAMAAVIAAIEGADDPEGAARDLVRTWTR